MCELTSEDTNNNENSCAVVSCFNIQVVKLLRASDYRTSKSMEFSYSDPHCNRVDVSNFLSFWNAAQWSAFFCNCRLLTSSLTGPSQTI